MDERRREDVAPEHPSLTVRELAVLLGLSESTIRRMLHKGLLTGRREGRTWRIDAEAVRSHKQPQTSGASDREPPNFGGSSGRRSATKPPGPSEGPGRRLRTMTSAWLGMDMSKTFARGPAAWRGGGLSHYSSTITGYLLAGTGNHVRGPGGACARAGCTVRDVREKRIAVRPAVRRSGPGWSPARRHRRCHCLANQTFQSDLMTYATSAMSGVRVDIRTPGITRAGDMDKSHWHRRERSRHRGYEARGRGAAGRRRRAREGLLPGPGVAPGRRHIRRRAPPGGAVHPTGLARLDPVRQGDDDDDTRLGAGPDADRRGHRGRPGRVDQPRRGRQRGLARRRAEQHRAARARSRPGAPFVP